MDLRKGLKPNEQAVLATLKNEHNQASFTNEKIVSTFCNLDLDFRFYLFNTMAI